MGVGLQERRLKNYSAPAGNVSECSGIYILENDFNYPELTEEELIHECVRKNAESQRHLFDRYSGKLMTICRRYASNQQEAEDMLQEAFIKIFSHIDQFKFQGLLEGSLKRITINAALRVLQKSKVHFVEIRDDQASFYLREPPSLADYSEEKLLEIINSLPDGYRVVFNLHALEGYSHEEIANLVQVEAPKTRGKYKTD
jgi:RNA polymerase sigma factor (sigma-70 family)